MYMNIGFAASDGSALEMISLIHAVYKENKKSMNEW